ncbi:LysM peptidoglycan-binding domain-containing protein [Pseudogulbenkiania ferrooxidans]|uniref:Peptidoglycan-binding LysM n=1 Tax=Pseudogulbenkiania ferrooxidans 2002 TaxID=279714 RepID=B9Z7T2_9NEIS|nr:N-acetylmuramidase domain-containing protein [Pseudogulbenkiania ferrooxidans]EEG07218.1 Peptidoglycan-binding LysM [Pseudogulbenkiania ferrooxidans 2002]
MTQMPTEIHIVQEGDTLSLIAKSRGVPLSKLIKLNKLQNPNRLQVGQPIYLSERAAFSIRVLFLDALRHPIENLAYQLVIDGKAHHGKAEKNGLSDEKVTRHADSTVEILAKDFMGNWQRLGATVSGYGEKLITLVSPYISFKDQLEPHPAGAPTTPTPADKKPVPSKAKPDLPKKPAGNPVPNNPDVKKKKKKGKEGESVIEIGVDLPKQLLQYMQAFEEKPISKDDWSNLARDLKCEVNVLKAIAKVESGGRSAFWVINDTHAHKVHAPKLVFERHHFHRLTCANGPHFNSKKKRYHGPGVPGCKSPYDIYPDICWPVAYRKAKYLKQEDKALPDGRVDNEDIYDNRQDYLRLINAYGRNSEAALKSASWGKFQVMGFNHAACNATEVETFVQMMCRNEAGQIELLAGFIEKNPGLWAAVKAKDWANIAKHYNGPSYKTYNYDVKLKEAYEQYCKMAG